MNGAEGDREAVPGIDGHHQQCELMRHFMIFSFG
jgi:hypothetical protein